MRLDLGLNLGIYNRLEQSSLVLDLLSVQSSAAYSLRKLRSAYTGSAIRVRRSQDNAEADIGFTGAGDLDQTALMSHVGYENAFTRSEEFDNVAWSKGTGATITANATTDPLGGNTADRYNTISAGQNFIYQSIFTSGIKTQSIYAKQGSNRYLWIYAGATGNNYGALFDLQNGVVVTTNTNGTPTSTSAAITSVGNGWYRCSITYLPSSNIYQAFSSTNNPTPTYSANNDITNGTVGNIFIWGAQLQNSGTLAPYQQTVATAWTSLDGFVTTWYDQSGNSYNVTQAAAVSQPRIVASGVLVTTNGKPAPDFGSGKNLFNSSIPMATIFPSQASVFRVININADSSYSTLGEHADHWDAFAGTSPNSNASGYIGIFAAPRIAGFPAGNIPTNGIHLVTYIASTQYSVYYNGISKGTSAYTYSSMNGTGVKIGTLSADVSSKGLTDGSTIQEVIFYNTDQAANRTTIESNINAHYGIY